MGKLVELQYSELIRKLKKHGFRFYRSGKGSHEIWVRDEDGKVIPVPHHKGKAIKKGTIRAIIRELGVTVGDFMGE